MNDRGSCLGVVLVVVIVTARYARITSGSGENSNVAAEQASNKTDVFHNSTLWNGSSEICDASAATNMSTAGNNVTVNVSECHQDERPPSSGNQGSAGLYFSISLGVWSVFTNSLPLAAIIKQEQLHKPVYILMANLAASDVSNGISFVLVSSLSLFYRYAETIPPSSIARLLFMSIFLSGLSSAYGLMALTAERYWFIVHGMTYVNNVTNDKCKVVIVIAWVWSVLLSLLPIFGWNCEARLDKGCLPVGGGLPHSYVAVVLVFIFIPMAAIILLNVGVFWCLWKHMAAIAAQEAAVGAEPSTSKKSAITIVIITVMFLVGWLPIFVSLAPLNEHQFVLYQMMVFIMLNSAINPVIYGFRLKEVRRGVARLFVSRTENPNLA